MTNAPRISVALCTYNGEAYLATQLESILAQSRSADEIIICDDASTDGTWMVLEKYRERFSHLIKLYRNDANLGISKNFEKAIGLCTGEFIALSAQDDIWHRCKLEKLARRLEADIDLGLIFSNAERIDSKGDKLTPDLWHAIGFDKRAKAGIQEGRGLQTLLRKNFVTGCTVMFRATLKAMCLPICEPLAEDHWISLGAAATSRVDFVDEKLVKYRQHNANTVGARKLSVKEHLDKSRRLGVSEDHQNMICLEKLVKHLTNIEQSKLSLIQQKIDFLRFRTRLWSGTLSWPQRAALLGHNAVRGRYHRWGSGWRALIKDLALLFGIVRRPESSTTHIPGTGA